MISVIVPIYNGEKYMGETVESVLKQSYHDIEVILINDGSTDKSIEICQEFQKRDSRVKLINQKNQGLSVARNTGIENSKGEYLFFLDADDVLEKDALEIMYSYIEKNLDNVAICNFCKFHTNRIKSEKENNYKVVEYTRETYMKKIFLLEKNTYAWGMLIPRKIMFDIKFPDGKYFEDMATMYKIILQADKIIYVDKILVWYRQHEGSIVSYMNEKKAKDYIEAVESMSQYVNEKIPQLYKKSIVIQCYCKIAVLERSKQYEDQEFVNKQYKFVSDNITIARDEVRIPIQKIKFQLYKISPQLYFRVNKIKKNR